ncbi:hypothetical protein LOTGIDRAFT_172204 [Lottia gigantea]|uniref:HD domain-containing protein n=1 Tax=Lottia gigantea TaxID=225164 RepID=V4AXK4_LOTGI|nr:hypothetical protein LOTGIDRAFT_172204 [Lottia gigantea]ESP02323.1 hypothetical protein LOTGIDRAFT_172204 [Lottia gigantea]
MSKSVDEIIRLYKQYGDTNYLGEAVTKTQHSIQCAQIAEAEGSDIQVIIGALLHDIGHLIGLDEQTASMVTEGEDLGAKDHDILGSDYLKQIGFPSKICEIVKGHVQAKRYLVFKYPEYYSRLSDASKMTLEHQGGNMSENEASQFENSPLFETIISMRRWDEQAKNPEIPDNDIENYRNYLQQVINM